MKVFPSIRIEGGLLGPDMLDQVLSGALLGQRLENFGLKGRRSLMDEIASVFAEARALWEVFQNRLKRLSESDIGTSLTRDAWVIPFLHLLDYELRYNSQAYEVGGRIFSISHRAGEAEDAPPVHIVGVRQALGRVAPNARPRIAPHALLQEFLNGTDRLWGIVTNGLTFRLLRDSTYIRRQAYIEFDLAAMLEGQLFEDFVVLYRLLHRSRLPQNAADAQKCFLELYYRYTLEQGGRVRDRLRDGVEECIRILANGFLAHDANKDLQKRVATPQQPDPSVLSPSLSPEEFYRQLLCLVYRFLFLLVSEDRGLISSYALYREHYGISRLRRLVNIRATYDEYDDLWQSLRVLWKVLSNESLAPYLQVAPLNGELFAPLTLDACTISNRDLLTAFWHLVYYRELPSNSLRRVNYGALDVEELGSVYESLLDYHPQIDTSKGVPQFKLAPGSERKSTGSYYTPEELVTELIRSALEPIVQERLTMSKQKAERSNPSELTPQEKRYILQRLAQRGRNEGKAGFSAKGSGGDGMGDSSGALSQDEKAFVRVWQGLPTSERYGLLAEYGLLSIRVVDPACGSGHFLLAAARRLGKELARIRAKDGEPSPEEVRRAIREVVSHCIYGVDKNPLAVELCQVALWLEAHCEGMPLTFLEHRIRCGDSLVGIIDPHSAEKGIPDGAFEPNTHDDRSLASKLKKRNKKEREKLSSGQLELPFAWSTFLPQERDKRRSIEAIPDDTPQQVRQKREQYRSSRADAEWRRRKEACDLWVGAFFQRYDSAGVPITTEGVRARLLDQAPAHLLAKATSLAHEYGFFHWPLEFPEVFEQGGFDVVLSNPPWERIKLQEEEFFASRDPEIARASNAAARKRLIANLSERNPSLWQDYLRALHAAESTSRYLRGSEQYPHTSRGDINTYSVFAERIRRFLHPKGRAGLIVPTGIATDATNQHFFTDLVDKGQLVSLFDFENREKLFPEVDIRMKFSLLTLCGEKAGDGRAPAFAFFILRTENLGDKRRVLHLSREDIYRLNPNTQTLPLFRTQQDAALTRAIYERVPVLINEKSRENAWGVRFLNMFHMANDSHLFRTGRELEGEGLKRVGNVYEKGSIRYLPLYEAKMIWQYDHRYGTYAGVRDRSSTQLPAVNTAQHADPTFCIQPWYWVPTHEVDERLENWKHKWLIGFRDVTNATNERTGIFTILPRVGVGGNLPVLLFFGRNNILACCLLANLNAQVFDCVTRQKIGGVHMSLFSVKQLPVLLPGVYGEGEMRYIVPRVLELVYTAWDMKGFADDVWVGADGVLRVEIERRWEANRRASGGVDGERPARVEVRGEGIPLAPFRWDEERRSQIRAELDAYYARLYGLSRKQLRYILDPADLTERELEGLLESEEEVQDPLDKAAYEARVKASTFPGETFRVLKEKEMRQYGEYRTRRLILEAWERLERGYGLSQGASSQATKNNS